MNSEELGWEIDAKRLGSAKMAVDLGMPTRYIRHLTDEKVGARGLSGA